jgi:nucleoside-triphosphatase
VWYEKKFICILDFWSDGDIKTEKRVFLITGSPGVGKTTVLTKTLNILRERGYSVGGMLSCEVRENGVRIGFEIIDLHNQKHGWLAQINQAIGPQIGKYHVNLKDLEIIGARAILNAVGTSDIVAIDEIGPMELLSQEFRNATIVALKSNKLIIAVVHWKANDKLITDVKSRMDAEIFEVTCENRDGIAEKIAQKVASKNT